MKFYLDENFPPDLLGIVRLIYDDHEFVSWRDEKLGGATDVELFWTLPERGYSAIITRDRRQLSNVDEKSALLDSGLIWVGVRDVTLKGREKLAVTAASLISGLGHVIDAAREGARIVQVNNVPHTVTQRIKVIPVTS